MTARGVVPTIFSERIAVETGLQPASPKTKYINYKNWLGRNSNVFHSFQGLLVFKVIYLQTEEITNDLHCRLIPLI